MPVVRSFYLISHCTSFNDLCSKYGIADVHRSIFCKHIEINIKRLHVFQIHDLPITFCIKFRNGRSSAVNVMHDIKLNSS